MTNAIVKLQPNVLGLLHGPLEALCSLESCKGLLKREEQRLNGADEPETTSPPSCYPFQKQHSSS